jgi:DNA-binding CsgD family transcriptional regulator
MAPALPSDQPGALIDRIYKAAFDPSLWPQIMAQLCEQVGGGPTMLIRKSFVTGQGNGLYNRIDPTAFTDYYGRFARANPLAKAVADLPVGSFLLDWQVMEKDELLRSEYYNDFLNRHDIHGVLGLKLWQQGEEATILNIARPRRAGEFQLADAALLAPYLDHLRRAVDFADRLPYASQGAAALDPLAENWADGLLLLDRDGRILYANRMAQALLARRDAIMLSQGQVTALDRSAAGRLTGLIAKAALPPGLATGGSVALPRATGRPLGARVMPAPLPVWPIQAGRTRVVVSLTDLDAPRRPDARLLAETFNLSRAQTAIALRLLDGEEPEAIAAALGISRYTVRRHITELMTRTGTNRQAMLLRVLARIPAEADGPWSAVGPIL